MNKTIITIMVCIMMLPMALAIAPAPNGECYRYEPVRLLTGWNGVGVITDYTDLASKTINITLANNSASGQENLIGNSFMDKISVNTITFYDSAGNSYNYQDAINNNWIEAIRWVENGASQDTSGNPNKYNKLVSYEAFWIKSYLAVNMSYTGNVESIGNTYAYNDLRFSNGTDEKNVTEARSLGWLNNADGSIQYWNTVTERFEYVCSYIYSGGRTESELCLTTDLNSQLGYLIVSGLDNIYLLTNNETKPCTGKIKAYGNPSNNNKIKPSGNTSNRNIFMIISSWAGRLFGGERNWADQ